jgi:hypothetical protein
VLEKEERGQQVGLEGEVIVLTAERDLWQEVCGREKGGVEAGGGAGGTGRGGLEMIVVWLVDCLVPRGGFKFVAN